MGGRFSNKRRTTQSQQVSSVPSPAGGMSSAEGGRRNWRGIRFETAFAVLGLVRCIREGTPLGLDNNTLQPSQHIDLADLSFRPQSDGAVDDLVASVGGRKIVAYQAKSGLGRLPLTEASHSETVSALKQAGRELRDPFGADVVVLVFGSMSQRLRTFARWLQDGDAPRPSAKVLGIIARILDYSPRSADWQQLRTRLRLIEMGSVADLATRIDLELAHIYPTPQLRIQASDALKELVADRSDEAGASRPPINTDALREWFFQRDLPPIYYGEQYRQEIPVLERTAHRFLDEVQQVRGSLPGIARPAVTQKVVSRLADSDIVLLGAGGSGKSEIQAQVIMEMLAEGWLPLVIRREDLGYGAPDLSSLLGVAGRVQYADVIRQLIERDAPERILLVLDGLDEMYRTSGEGAGQRVMELYRVLYGLRERLATRDHLRILLSCRTSDWERLQDSSIGKAFESFLVPPLTHDEIVSITHAEHPDSDTGTDIFQRFIAVLPAHLVSIVLSRPILLRLAYELWLGRTGDASRRSRSMSVLKGIISDLKLWRAYYDECVCSSDRGLVVSTPAGEVKQCHHEMALAHIEDYQFVLSVPVEPLERSHPRAFQWLRSLEVAVLEAVLLSRSVRFFHPSYADFALALALSQEKQRCVELARSPGLAIMLGPVWSYITRFWVVPQKAITYTRDILGDPDTKPLARQGILNGWLDWDGLDEHTASALIVELLDIQNERQPLLDHLLRALLERLEARTSRDTATVWLHGLRQHFHVMDFGSLNTAMRLFNTWAEQLPDSLHADLALGQLLGWEGVQRAQQLASDPHQFDNARVLARNAATAISYSLAVATSAEAAKLSELPIEQDGWPMNPGLQSAAWLAVDVRNVLTRTAALLRMNQSPAATCDFLCRILASFTSENVHAPLSRPQQTEYLNLSFSLQDMWEQSWRNTVDALPALFLAGGSVYLQVSVVGWICCGYAECARYSKSYPAEIPGEHWLHDKAQSWWGRGHSLELHRDAVHAGLDYVGAQLQQSNIEPLRRFRDLVHEVRWAGLAARFVEAVAKGLQQPDVSESVRHEAAVMAAEMLLMPGSLLAAELHQPAVLALPHIVASLEEPEAEELWAKLCDLQDLDRIAAQPLPEAPDPENVRKEHERSLMELRHTHGNGAENDPFGSAQVTIDFLQKIYTPERMFQALQQNYLARKQIKEAAGAGSVPWGHPDIIYVLDILREFHGQGKAHLIPEELRALYDEAQREISAEKILSSTQEVAQEEWNSIHKPSEPTEPRARFCDEADQLERERLNRQDPLPVDERDRIRDRIEEARKLVGVHEPSPEILPAWSEPDARSRQPAPKLAWLKYIVTYLEGLPQEAPHELSAEAVSAIIHLARDTNPTDISPAGPVLLPNVRGLAAECLALLLVHGGEAQLIPSLRDLMKDPSPEVRRGIWHRARRVMQARSELYEPLLSAFVQETDPYLLDFYDDALLRVLSQDTIPAADRIIGPLLDRLFLTSEVPLTVADEDQRGRNGITRTLASRAIAFIYHGEAPRMHERVPHLLRARAWEVTDHRIGWFITESTLRLLVDHDVEDDWPIILLEVLQERAAITSEARNLVGDKAVWMEIRAQTEILGTLGSALLGDLRIWELASDFSSYPKESRKGRLSAGLQRFEPHIRKLWQQLVHAWVRSDLHGYVQRLILHAVRVQRILARENAADSAYTICAWRVANKLMHWEYNLQTEFADLLDYLLLRPQGEINRSVRLELAALLNSLAEAGNSRAQAVAAAVANQVRRS
jgi:hypothetical protein